MNVNELSPVQDDEILKRLKSLMQSEFFATNHPTTNPSPLYRPLENKTSIRVLVLHPGVGKTSLKGSLEHIALIDRPRYEALSYVWGSTRKCFSITIDGQTTPITESLCRALLRLRDGYLPRTVWIDALCINQDDSEEKSSQVSIMSQIYSFADRVLCWLGEDMDGDGRKTFELLERIGKADFSDLTDGNIDDDFMRFKNLPLQGDPMWHASFRFFQRPWFKRVWVIQEFVLGRRVDMLCGDAEASWRMVNSGIDNFHIHALFDWGTSHMIPFHQKVVVNENITLFRAMLALKIMQNAGDTFALHVRHSASSDARKLDEETAGQSLKVPEITAANAQSREMFKGMGTMFNPNEEVAEALNLYAKTNLHLDDPAAPALCDLVYSEFNSLSTDPRDRFFGLLSLSAQRDDPGLQPDYSESTESTYTRYAHHFLLNPDDKSRKSRTLITDLLVYAGFAHRHPGTLIGDLDLPSWVPEPMTSLEYAAAGGLLSGQAHFLYSAGGPSLQKCRETGDSRTILITGGSIDTITKIIPQPRWPSFKPLTSTTPPSSAKPPLSQAEKDRISTSFSSFFAEMDSLFRRETPYPYLIPSVTSSSSQHPTEAPGLPPSEILWRTLTANLDQRYNLAKPEYARSYELDRYMFQTLALRETIAEKMCGVSLFDNEGLHGMDWGVRWQRLAAGTDVCETTRGFLGLVPRGSRVGDEVVVVRGESLPFVFRKAEGGEGEEGYRVVGGCYVHGIMDGEAIEGQGWREEEFLLV